MLDEDRLRKLTGEKPTRGGYVLRCSPDVAERVRGSLPAWTEVVIVDAYNQGQWKLALIVPLGSRRILLPGRYRRPPGRPRMMRS